MILQVAKRIANIRFDSSRASKSPAWVREKISRGNDNYIYCMNVFQNVKKKDFAKCKMFIAIISE